MCVCFLCILLLSALYLYSLVEHPSVVLTQVTSLFWRGGGGGGLIHDFWKYQLLFYFFILFYFLIFN